MNWTTKDIPPQAGRLAVVTGATGGLGLQTALELARAGAEVIVTGRNADKGQAALAAIWREVPAARISYRTLDLSSLATVAQFVEGFLAQHQRLDLLVNNGAVMAPPNREETSDGFERQLGTNYLSHFALVAGLLPALQATRGARVVTLSSLAALQGRIHFEDLQMKRSYAPMVAYSQSKLACLIFAFELQRHSAANGWGFASVAAHPGISRTDLISNGMGSGSGAGLVRRFAPFLFQPVEQGALPTLMAATARDAAPGGYYGPQGLMELRGAPGQAKAPAQALDRAIAQRLWTVSETLTGLSYKPAAAAA